MGDGGPQNLCLKFVDCTSLLTTPWLQGSPGCLQSLAPSVIIYRA